MDINIFTAAMRSEFLNSIQVAADPAPYEAFTTIVPSTARIENYAWMSPAPGISEYIGHRRFGQIGNINYTVANKEFDGAYEVLTRDIEDDQVGGYTIRAKDLGIKAKLFPGRHVLKTLSLGASSLGFDGTNFFSTTHNLGTAGAAPAGFGGGGNALTFNPASNDAVASKFIILIHTGALKPMLYQNRKGPKFMTNAGTPESEKAKKAQYWCDMEGSGAFGYWWDAVQVSISDTPTLAELATCLDAARSQLRTFALPVALASDSAEYVHEQTLFNLKTATIVCSTNLEAMFWHLLTEDRINLAENIYRGWANLVTTAFLN